MEYVFAVCEGDTFRLPAELVDTFELAVSLARAQSVNTGKVWYVFPLKTPDWQGICGNCGKPWKPAHSQPVDMVGA
jgi:hypothetical protein